ncbi:MAG: outer membrane protein assembly factor BamB family protein [Gaiellales bacterium]
MRAGLILAVLAVFALPASAQAATPTITGFTPGSGPAGTVVTISGTGFAGALKVTFGGASAAFNVVNPTTIRAIVPALAHSGVVIVDTPGGSTESRTPFALTTGIVPSVGSAPPGGRFTLSGSGFPASSDFTIDLDSAVLASGVTNRLGGFQGLQITVPAEETLDFHQLSLVEATGSTFPIQFLIQADWPFGRQNVFGTGQNVLESTLNVSTVNAMTQKWNVSTTGSLGNSPPAVAGGVLYMGTFDGKVLAVDTSTHAKLWSVKPSSEVTGSPAVDNGTVYVGDGSQVFALNAATGATKWSITTSQSPAGGAPTVVNGTLYFGGTNNVGATLYAVNSTTGAIKWATQLSSAMLAGSPAFANGLVFIGASDGTLYAVHAGTGVVAWSKPVGGPILGTPAVGGGMVFVDAKAKSGTIAAFAAGSGAPKWSFDENANGSPAYDAGKVFFTTASGVSAVQATTGSNLWSFSLTPVLTLISDSPAVANGLVYDDYNGYPIALIESTGAQIWQPSVQLSDPASPVVVDGQVFVGAADDRMHVYAP